MTVFIIVFIDKKMNRTDLHSESKRFNVLAKISRNEFVSLECLCKICTTFNCGLEDIVEI